MSYTPPAANEVDFDLVAYTPLSADAVDFDLASTPSLQPPSGLTATVVSSTRVDLDWEV